MWISFGICVCCKRFTAMQRAPDAALWTNMPDHIVIPAHARPVKNRAQQQPQQQQLGIAPGPINFGGRQAPRQPVAQQRRPQPYSNRGGQQNRQNRGSQNRQNRGGQNR